MRLPQFDSGPYRRRTFLHSGNAQADAVASNKAKRSSKCHVLAGRAAERSF